MHNNFTFIVPMYNASKTLSQMLLSVYAQTHQNWKIILIDDCSNEYEQQQCELILKKFESLLCNKTQVIQVIWNSRCNRGKQWEMSNVLFGLTFCDDNDIICRIDADDWLTDIDGLTILNQVYNEHKLDAIWTAHRWNYTNFNISNALKNKENVYKANWVSSHLKTFRKKIINDIPYENFLNQDNVLIKRAGDQGLYLPVLHKANAYAYLPIVMYHYSIDEKNGEVYQSDDAKFQKLEADFIRSRGYVSTGTSWQTKVLNY